MREIEHARDAVDQRQPEGDQRVEPAEQDAADQQLDDDRRHALLEQPDARSVPRSLRRSAASGRRGPVDASGSAHCQVGDGQAILPVAWSGGQTTTGSPFCI